MAQLNDEISDRKHAARYSTQVMNPYFHTEYNPDYPAGHPVNTFIERSSGFIPGDAWESDSATNTLFRAPEVARFIADCLEIPALYCYDDPLAGLTSNICDPGQQSNGTGSRGATPSPEGDLRPRDAGSRTRERAAQRPGDRTHAGAAEPSPSRPAERTRAGAADLGRAYAARRVTNHNSLTDPSHQRIRQRSQRRGLLPARTAPQPVRI